MDEGNQIVGHRNGEADLEKQVDCRQLRANPASRLYALTQF